LASSEKSQRERGKHGGTRLNAGRKKSKEFRFDPSHAKRPALSFKHPVHVIMRALPDVPRLRQRVSYEVIRTTLLHYLERAAFRIVHISIQRNHLHLIVEAADKDALRHGIQGFKIRLARALNVAFDRGGKVFAFRYEAKQIKTARYARNVISYVLNNWRRHREDRRAGMESMPFDQFSSAWAFAGWSAQTRHRLPDDGLPVSQARTGLLASAWEWFGLIDPFEVPGPMH
jgi:REP element-mobilizing transposase RayT